MKAREKCGRPIVCCVRLFVRRGRELESERGAKFGCIVVTVVSVVW